MSANEVNYGPKSGDCSRLLDILTTQAFSQRLWAKDPTVWRQGPDGAGEITNRLGWLDVMSTMQDRLGEIAGFADEVKEAGFKHVVLLGMGGSSLSPEVSKLTFGIKSGYPDLMVLDSTVPESVLKVEKAIDPKKTLFVVAMKSGSTVETNSCYRYFYSKVGTGDNFAAITDPGTSLETEANDKKFRKLFLNMPDIGGRFSALSYFGLVAAALIGVDISTILERAQDLADACKPGVPLTSNPGVVLGALLAENALRGRDKLTLILPSELTSFGYWVEQLVAESTGKFGQGVLPIEGEPVMAAGSYGDDRVFVYTSIKGQKDAALDAKVSALETAGLPVIRIEMNDVYDIGAEYFRWEMATSVACALLGVNAFDQPNVQESKDNTKSLLNSYDQTGSLPESAPIFTGEGISLFCDSLTKAELDAIRQSESLESYVGAFLNLYQPGNYFALMAFLSPSDATDSAFAEMRSALSGKYNAATTLGHGPRFLHSTGQFHKGGPNSGIFIQFTADDAVDLAIPAASYSFSTLKNAQALGDSHALMSKGRPFLRIHLGADAAGGLKRILSMI